MGDIYGQSLLTIAASSASTSNAGFSYRKNGVYWLVRNHHLFNSCATGNVPEVLMLKAFLPSWEDIDESLPLSNRGWVLQERLLASCTLSWTEHGIFWLCDEEDTSEYDGFYSKDYIAQKVTKTLHDVCEKVKEYTNTSKSYARMDPGSDFNNVNFSYNPYERSLYLTKWYYIVGELSHRLSTVASDRIPAITGLGKEIASITGTEFVNGTFRPISPRELCWIGCSFQSAQRIPGVHSWSWASIDQRVFLRSLTNFRLLARSTISIANRYTSVASQDLYLRQAMVIAMPDLGGSHHGGKTRTRLSHSTQIMMHRHGKRAVSDVFNGSHGHAN